MKLQGKSRDYNTRLRLQESSIIDLGDYNRTRDDLQSNRPTATMASDGAEMANAKNDYDAKQLILFNLWLSIFGASTAS